MTSDSSDAPNSPALASAPMPKVWPTYMRLVRYALRYKGRLAIMLAASLLIGASLGSMILLVGSIVNVLYMDEANLADYVESVKEDAHNLTVFVERYVGWAPTGLDARAEDLILSMRADRTRALRTVVAIIVVLVLVGGIARFSLEYYAGSIGVNISIRLQEEMFASLLNLSHRFFDGRSAGEIVARFTNDVFVVNRGLMDVFTRVFREPIKIAFCLGIALSVNPFLTMVVLFVLSPLILVVMGISSRVRTAVYRSLRRIASLAQIVTESVQGISVVKGFRMEGYERRRLAKETARLRVHMKNLLRAEAAVSPASEVVMVVSISVILLLGERQVASGLSSGSLVILFGAIAATLDPLRKLSRVMNMVQISATSASRVFEFIDYEPGVQERAEAVELPPLQKALRFENVSFSYDGETEVLSGIDFEIRCGEMVALVGFSGSGKSTVAKLVPRFYDPTGGRITLDGVDIRDASFESLRGQIGIVTQETILFAESVRKNIAYGREDILDERVREAARAANADGFIENLAGGYDAVLAESGGNLSGGQRQRLAIARAIVKDSPILILDEATSSLDSESERAILEAIDNLAEGRTTLVIAHRLSTVQKADRIIVLDDGHVVEQGTHAELLARDGIYKRLYRLQLGDLQEEAG